VIFQQRRNFFKRALASLAPLVLTSGLGLYAPSAAADAFPNKMVKIVVPYSAGGSTDAIMRMIAEQLAREWGQPVIIENRPGANGILGAQAVTKAPADGYTALFSLTGLIQNQSLYKKIPYDTMRDLAPVSMIGISPIVYVVGAESPIKTLKDYVAHIKATPSAFGSFGAGSTAHLYGEQIATVAGVPMTHVPYKGEQPMLTDLVSGRVSGGFISPATGLAQARGGKLRILATTGARRSKLMPDVPTFIEQGMAGFEPLGWYGLFVPAGTPADIVAKFSADVNRIAKKPEIVARLYDFGMEPVGTTPEEFTSTIREDLQKWDRLIKKSGIQLD
jgi:tripartite-type tricarboxylate transporter receptor subunit TctC